jgi:hypothetical protein
MPDTEAILENCLASERQATAAGYRGVRYAGTHECGLQGGIQGHNIKVLCMHPIVPAASVEARRVLTSHAGLFVKGGERWHRLIATNFREAKAVLAALGGRA